MSSFINDVIGQTGLGIEDIEVALKFALWVAGAEEIMLWGKEFSRAEE